MLIRTFTTASLLSTPLRHTFPGMSLKTFTKLAARVLSGLNHEPKASDFKTDKTLLLVNLNITKRELSQNAGSLHLACSRIQPYNPY